MLWLYAGARCNAFQERSRPVASAASVIGRETETRPVLILPTGGGFAQT